MDDTKTGVFRKYIIQRTHPSPKHEKCSYFVLDVKHDPFAIPALKAYAEACRTTHPLLADDLERALSSDDPSEALNDFLNR
jgi:hypothetical protein